MRDDLVDHAGVTGFLWLNFTDAATVSQRVAVGESSRNPTLRFRHYMLTPESSANQKLTHYRPLPFGDSKKFTGL
jgi:hypothetical protein